MSKQNTNTVLMVEPVAFAYNVQTAENNHFQQNDSTDNAQIQSLALVEFQATVALLRSNGLTVLILKDTLEPHTPDSIFPNNWFSFHGSKAAMYPMYAQNRRLERRACVFELAKEAGFAVENIKDYSHYEKQQLFLEGTGSMILDRVSKIAYAALSERTDKGLFEIFCADFGYRPFSYTANQTVGTERMPIYHTNVQLCVAHKYVVVCLDAIDNKTERALFVATVLDSGKEIVEISEEQMQHFAGNMLQLANDQGELFLVLSQSAYDSLSPLQIKQLQVYNQLLVAAVPTIEKYGGGSVRCMIAEIF